MFFIMGINPREKQLDFSQSIRCKRCGRYGRLEVFLTCMCFNLFFIPLFRWNKQYYARTTCCGGAALLPKELGERIAAGEVDSIDPDSLCFSEACGGQRICRHCGYPAEESFSYCPNCGQRL